ncbi:SMP-30/gluconolactonase/LRE family protein [Sphingobium sp. V4]|uniref:SMP-30/gluconolactonase/LRE family protein n=1 Tax=Sphingobium sp. V4 TaxID=3038927 RepID=UPI002557CDE6|nr:SMP-30/gluconolactonase/LRE family protein [Sphingobium sp. V4]WIW89421.1 SMP-30/gluconolactonase/LRE family protein [Sphingobium sp. V4]
MSSRLAAIGESPLWSEREQAVYYIDCNAPALYRLTPATGEERAWKMPCRIGGVVLSESGPVVALKTGIFALDPIDGSLTEIAPAPLNDTALALHEARCDPAGRLWVGVINLGYVSHGKRGGAELFRLDGGRLVSCAEAAGGTVSNGLAWSRDGSTLYYADTAERIIWAFDYDVATGSVGRRREFHRLPEGMGVPDGATVDSEDGYWFACAGAGRLRRLAADGTLEHEFTTPCDWPTKPAFGGPQLETVFVTSLSIRGAKPGKEELEGRLFAMPAPVRGLTETLFKAIV